MSPRTKRVIATAIRIPISAAIVVSLIFLAFSLKGVWQMLFIGALAVLLLGRLIWCSVYASKMGKKIDGLLDILYKEANPEKFIAESGKLLGKTKLRTLRCTLSINLAVGYEAVGRFDEAIRVLKQIDMTGADRIAKAMYYANAASFYAENGAVREALEMYTKGKPYFDKTAKNLSAGHLKLSRGILYFANEQYEDALDAFEKARGMGFDDRHSMTKTQLFEARALAKCGKPKEAANLYRKILQKNTYPYLLECAKTELEDLGKIAE